ncbi:MAG TPA: TonB-dependent siderophore receptor [Lysobacter sp.]|jgi:catecholate siderophore receptor|nr:TonB-dependent siderophore receptor [Lysobacter sp.]
MLTLPGPARLALAVFVSLYAAPSLADDNLVHELDTIEVIGTRQPKFGAARSSSSTKTDTPLIEVPQAITVLPRALIDAQGGRSLNEILGFAPGVGLSNGDGQRDQVSIRGFTAIADQYLDGVRDDALYFRDLANIERIEVLKGPSAMIFGRGSSGGLVNRVSKQPVGTPLAMLRLQLDSEGGARSEADFGGVLGPGTYRLVGAVEDSDTFRDQGFTRRAFLAPSYRFDLGAGSLLLQASMLVDRRITDFGIPSLLGSAGEPGVPVEVSRSTYYGSADASEDDYTDTRVHTFNSVYSQALGNDWDMRLTLRGTDYWLGRRNTLVTGSPFLDVDGRWKQHRRYSGIDRDQQSWFGQADFIREGERHRLLAGVELGSERKVQWTYGGTAIDIDLLAPVLNRPTLGAMDGSARSWFDNAALYLQDQITLAAQWKAVLGARFDEYRQHSDNRLDALPPFERTDREWSPRAGLIWMPTAQQSLYANWGSSFQPSAETFPLNATLADLQPEQTENREIGYKLATADGRVSFDVAVFDTERDHIKTNDPTTPGKTISVGTQRTRGVELGLAASLLAQRLDLYAGYAYLDAEITRSNSFMSFGGVSIPLQGKTPSLTPENSASLFAEYDLGHGLRVGGLAQHVGLRYAAPTNATVLKAYTRYDAHVVYGTGPWQARLRVENLFDKRYFVSAHGGVDGYNTPGAPRTFSVTLDYRF